MNSRLTSIVEPGILYEVPQERDVIKPSRERYEHGPHTFIASPEI